METIWNKYKKPELLKPGQKVVYELIDIRKDKLDPRGERLAIPVKKAIQNKCRVFDPDLNDYIDIAYIEGYATGGKPIFGQIFFESDKRGRIFLRGGNPSDQRKYEFMERSNENLSNPNRITSVRPIFKRVDFKKDREKKREERSYLKDALTISEGLSESMLLQIAIALNMKVPNSMTADEKEELKMRIEEFAAENPKKFIAMTENKDLAIMEVANDAIKRGLLVVNKQHRKITTQSGELVCNWETGEKDINPIEKFVGFVKSDAGSKFYAELKEQMKKK